MIYLVTDTNFFIQYKKYDEINFQELFDDKPTEFTLLIPRTVISELDKHKHQGNDRVSRKAREMTPLLRKIIKEPIVQDKHNYKLTIDRLKRISTKQDHSNDLDLNNPDEKIIDEVLNWKNLNANKKIFLITGDMAMCSLCHDYGIEHIELPENCLLPPEQDEKKKEIEKLKKELLELKNQVPILNIMTNSPYSIEVSTFRRLNDSQVSILAEKIQKKYPAKDVSIYTKTEDKENTITNNLFGYSSILMGQNYFDNHYIEPTKGECLTYENDYTNWRESLTNRIIEINNKKIINAKLYTIEFSLKNEGKVFAEDVLLSIETDDVLLCAPYNDNDREELNNIFKEKIIDVLNPLFPPKAPEYKKRIFRPFDSLLDLSSSMNNNNPNREPFRFYYYPNRPRTEFTKEIKFSCSKFRHDMESFFDINFLIPYDFNEKVLKISITISANNLETQKKIIIVKFDKKEINLLPTIEEIMCLNE